MDDVESKHCCDSIAFELMGTDCYHFRDSSSRAALTFKELQLSGENCEFCAGLAKLIGYRSKQPATWVDDYRYPRRRDGERSMPTEEEMKNAHVHISIHGIKEARNWSFGFEGTSHRTVLDVRVTPSSQSNFHFEITLQRSGPGGRVPVTRKSEDEYGQDTITYEAPGGWRVGSVDADGPQPATQVASLETALGRIRSLEVDYTMLRGWLDLCLSHEAHDVCRQDEEGIHIPGFRLVDVEDMCIWEDREEHAPPFATLSYVWGTEPFLRLVKDNLEALMTPGSLRNAPLPLTISDAIEVCRNLQIRYIWIDSLCIIQDDESDMLETIDSMDTIYRQSIVTIVAAAGVNAHAGIPGVRPGTRTLVQQQLEVRGVPLIDSVDHRQLRMQTSYEEPQWISGTPWAQRAWTFQEALVSRRILFFTAELVYWSCHQGLLSEDTVEHFEHLTRSVRLDDHFDPLEYQQIATTFSRRRLTFESDLGRAYLGTQNYLDTKWGGQKFSWGLPHGAFGSFLMWEWDFSTTRRQRQGTHPIKETNGTIARVPFPTWSWMGWMEGGQLIHFFGDEPAAHSPLFYTFDRASSLVEIQDGQHWRSLPKPIADLLLGESAGSGEVPSNRKTELLETEIPPELSATPPLKHRALLFYSQTATLRYDPSAGIKATSSLNIPSGLKMTRREYPFPIMIGENFYEILEDHQKDEANDENNKDSLRDIKLVAVFGGQMTKPRKFRGKFRIYIWPVIETSPGVWVRASYMSTVIFQDLWNILPRKKWELISIV
ncbi:unnamed protein product [Clonostachys byssicola]|uniref:Heterokaryon incompatibility domain-containing protein n=1 Tax=Clonostachys byssicola TaxID=160290 RepID=A0A9N9UED6_9HYPO|nr:unnamed protein product [Clonostachys byssicola]